MSAYAQPTQLIASMVKDTGNMFHRTKTSGVMVILILASFQKYGAFVLYDTSTVKSAGLTVYFLAI